MELPSIGISDEDIPELALTPETSPGPAEEANPELAMKQELDAISHMVPVSPTRRYETLSPLSALEDDEQDQSASTTDPSAFGSGFIVLSPPSGRREESLSPVSSLGQLESDESQPPLKSTTAHTKMLTSISVPGPQRRRSKRKLNGPPDGKSTQPKKLKTETKSAAMPRAKRPRGRPRKNGSKSAGATTTATQIFNPKMRFKSKSRSAAPVLCDWPAKTEDGAGYHVSAWTLQPDQDLDPSLFRSVYSV
jgi:hypothetical protein